MLSGFILINRRDAELAKVLKGMFSSICLRIRGTLCGLIWKRLTVRLPSAKIDEKKCCCCLNEKAARLSEHSPPLRLSC